MFFGLNLGLFVVMAMYVYMKSAKKAQDDMVLKWGPLALVVTGALLVMVDLTRHVLLDLDLAGEELAMYAADKDDGSLSTVGVIGVTCTWIGVACIATGIGWFVDLPGKISKAIAKADEERE